MEVRNSSYHFNTTDLVIKAAHTSLFAFTHLTLDSFLVERIRPEAQFLFAHLTHLTLLEIDTSEIENLTHAINQFKSCSVTKTLESITLEFRYLYRASQLKHHLANVYNITSILFKPDTYLAHNSLDMPRLVTEYSCFSEKLKELTLIDTDIKQIDSTLFKNFPRLETLNSFKNIIDIIQPGAFLNASSLLKMDISANSIPLLASNIFTGLTNLRFLKLKAKQFEPSAFNGLARLTHLDMSSSSGSFDTIPATLFDDLTDLLELDLTNCSIESIEPTVFNHLYALDKLNLCSNELEVFRTKCTPRVFDAKFNRLTTVVFEADDLTRLEEIDLSFNQLEMTCFDCLFSGVGQVGVQILNLSWNSVGGLEAGAFKRMQALQQLIFYGNNVSWITVGAFDGLRELVELHVAVASTRILECDVFGELSQLQSLEVLKNTQLCNLCFFL
jgi:Leucine-rich repeat (LRR) protein